jgi:hypothetical protein
MVKRYGASHHVVKDRRDLFSKMEISHVLDLVAKYLVFCGHLMFLELRGSLSAALAPNSVSPTVHIRHRGTNIFWPGRV